MNIDDPFEEQTLVERLIIRAGIRRQISSRKSVQEGKPDRIADLLEEAATEITRLLEENSKQQAEMDLMSKHFVSDDDLIETNALLTESLKKLQGSEE